MVEITKGQRVRYTAGPMANMRGKFGTVEGVTRNGWVEVMFDGTTSVVRCAQTFLQIVDARKELLEKLFDLMTEYLTDECPEEENWEDFDPEIDGIRSQVVDLGGGT